MNLTIEMISMYIVSLMLTIILIRLLTMLTFFCNSSKVVTENQRFRIKHEDKRKKTRSGKFY